MTAEILPANCEHCRVLVVGDVMLDRYWQGVASRISPEAPVPVVNISDTVLKLGGAANVAMNIAALDANVSLLGLVGQDDYAVEVENLLLKNRIESRLLPTHKPTITKLRVMGQNQQLLRLDFEKCFQSDDFEPLLMSYPAALEGVDVVLLSDYAKGTLYDVSTLIALARAKQIPVLVDPKGEDFLRYRGATLLTPNLKEFEAVVGPCVDRAEQIAKAQQLIEELDLTALLITLSHEGMLLVQRNQDPVCFAAKAREVYDVTGAGDTVIAVIATALAAGQTVSQAVELSNVAAGLVVAKLGSASVSVPELRRALQRSQDSLLGIVNEEELLQAVSDARCHNEKVVMTNGCFDILHAGHVQYLQEARALGYRLIVAVNDDDSVRSLKGESRPISTMGDRMEVIAALRCVDWVVPFSEITPQRLIESIKPDVLVKGDDYSIEEIAGSQAVLASGGEVQTLPLKPGCSTTGIVQRILKSEAEKV